MKTPRKMGVCEVTKGMPKKMEVKMSCALTLPLMTDFKPPASAFHTKNSPN